MVFFIFHKAWESILEYNYQDTYARALPSGDAMNYVEETFMSFSCVFSGLRERRAKLCFLLYGSPRQMVEGGSKQSLARHRAWLSSPHADVEQGLGKMVLSFSWCWSPAVSASALKGENCGSPIALWQLYGQFGEYWLIVLRDTIKCPEFPPYWMERRESLTAVFTSPRVGEL